MSAVEKVIAERKAAGSGALIGYLPVGFPNLQTSIDAAVALVENGVDVLELGVPYSDPVMDGLVIQKATQAALADGFKLAHAFEAVHAITSRVDAPVLVMTYFNPVFQYGVGRFADDLKAAGGAGLITPDLVADQADEWLAESDRTGLDRVFLAAPSSSDARLKLGRELGPDSVILVNLSGRGDKDMETAGAYFELFDANAEIDSDESAL